MTEAICGHKELDICRPSWGTQGLETSIACCFCPSQTAAPQDTDWCRRSSWLQKHGMGRMNGNTYFVVTSALACSETSARKAGHRGSGWQTLGQPRVPTLINWGAARHLDWGVHFKSICIHWNTLEFKTALGMLKNWSCSSRGSCSVLDQIALLK